jgi:hypothetical protein
MAETLAVRLEMVKNKFELLQLNLGEHLVPLIETILGKTGGALDVVADSSINDSMKLFVSSIGELMPTALDAMVASIKLAVPVMEKVATVISAFAIGAGVSNGRTGTVGVTGADEDFARNKFVRGYMKGKGVSGTPDLSDRSLGTFNAHLRPMVQEALLAFAKQQANSQPVAPLEPGQTEKGILEIVLSQKQGKIVPEIASMTAPGGFDMRVGALGFDMGTGMNRAPVR